MLTNADRCDAACPAQALVRVAFLEGVLDFCSHHYDKAVLPEYVTVVIDNRKELVNA